jgi:hypothetical protein
MVVMEYLSRVEVGKRRCTDLMPTVQSHLSSENKETADASQNATTHCC